MNKISEAIDSPILHENLTFIRDTITDSYKMRLYEDRINDEMVMVVTKDEIVKRITLPIYLMPEIEDISRMVLGWYFETNRKININE